MTKPRQQTLELPLIKLNNRPIGFSTGCLHRSLDTYSDETLRLLATNSSSAIEVICAYSDHVKFLPNMVEMLKHFEIKSVHLPVGLRYINNRPVRLMLGQINDFYRAIGASLAVVHPDLVDDWKVFKICSMQLAVENMDNRKNCFKYPQEFIGLFEQLPDWQFVLDLNHCYVNDKSMAIADEFVSLFGDRLAEIHLSGADADRYHKPLYLTDQSVIVDKIPAGNCPIIIESPFKKDYRQGPAHELGYIKFHSA